MTRQTDREANVMPFVMVFAVTYAVLTLVVFLLVTLLNLPANSGLAIGALIGAATFAAQRFASEIGRPPQGTETLKLSLLSLAAVILMSVPLTLGALALSGVPLGEFTEAIMALTASLGAGTAVGILAFTAAVHLAVLYLSYGPLARFIARNGSGRSGR